jgi:hypothetical protein
MHLDCFLRLPMEALHRPAAESRLRAPAEGPTEPASAAQPAPLELLEPAKQPRRVYKEPDPFDLCPPPHRWTQRYGCQ